VQCYDLNVQIISLGGAKRIEQIDDLATQLGEQPLTLFILQFIKAV
jgi:hypothetical protein